MRHRDLVLVAVAALLVRVVYLIQLGRYDLANHLILDPWFNDREARRILAGESFPGAFYQSPLYAYFLAGIYKLFGPNLGAVRAVQALLGCATTVLIADLGGRLFGRTAGVVAAVISLLYASYPYGDAQILKTSVTLFLTVLLFWLVTPRPRGALRVLLAGAVLGLATLTRENFLLFLPVGAALLIVSERSLRPALLFAGAALAVIAPATIHNYRSSGELILVSSQGGQNFFIGNFRKATGAYATPPFLRPDPQYEQSDFRAEAEKRTGRRLTEGEVSSYWYRAGMEEIAADPGHAARVLLRKGIMFFGGIELPDNSSVYMMRDVAPVLRLLPMSVAVLTPLWVLGVILERRRFREHLWLHAFVLVNCVSLVLFLVLSRIRIAVVPVITLFAAAALVAMARWLRERRFRPLLAALPAIACGMAILSIPDLAGFDPREYRTFTHYLNRAQEYEDVGNLPKAIDNYRAAIGVDSTVAFVHAVLGGCYEMEGRLAEARGPLETAVRLQPRNASSRSALGRVLLALGEREPAREQLLAARGLAPSLPDPLESLAALYASEGDSARAADAVRTLDSLRAAPPRRR